MLRAHSVSNNVAGDLVSAPAVGPLQGPRGPRTSGPMERHRQNILEVDGAAFAHNIDALARAAGPGVSVCAVIKAGGYGIGAVPAYRALAPHTDRFAVATVEEACELRAAGHAGPLLVLGGACWWDDPDTLWAHNLTAVVGSVDEVERLGAHASGRPLDVHLAVDTGLSREGVYVAGDEGAGRAALDAVLDAAAAHPALRLAGVMTHFANADLAEAEMNTHQVERFADVLDHLTARAPTVRIAHISNSAATLSLSGRPGRLADNAYDRFTWWARPGLGLYGVSPFPDGRCADVLRCAFRWRAPVVLHKRVPRGAKVSYGSTFTCARDTELALLGLGYADGYPRALSGQGHVMFGPHRAPILGRVCMDLIVVDVTDAVAAAGPGIAAPGALCTVLGGTGPDAVAPWPLAAKAGTIAYELMTSIATRVHRVAQ